MEHIDKEIYIAVIEAAGRAVDREHGGVLERVELLPLAFKLLIDAVQKHKDEWKASLEDKS